MRADATMRFLIILAAAVAASALPAAADDFVSAPDAKFTDVNQVGLMINNNGFLGTNLPSAGGEPSSYEPSFEYPLGTDLERIVRGGFWVGAVNVDNDTFVSTATIDGYAGTAVVSEFKDGPPLEERSSLRNSPVYDPDAVSEQDIMCFFVDTDSTFGSNHHPLKVRVGLKTYGWSFEPVNQFVILSYTIENVGRSRLQNLYIGMYGELISCSKAITRPFPSGCFDRKHIEYHEDLRLVGCHYYDFDQTLIPGWGGYSLLGSQPDSVQGKTVTFDWWEWNATLAERELDPIRYQKLSSGIVDSTITDTGPPSVDPVELLAVGPYRFLDPGDTLNVVFAFLGGKTIEDLQFRAAWAQRTFDSNYEIPEPPPSPRIFVDPRPNSLRLFWDASPETVPDPVLPDSLDFEGYRVYLSRDNVDFTLVGEYDLVDTIGFNTGLETVRRDTTIGGNEYRYGLDIPSLKDGFPYYVSVTSFDRGDRASGVPSLESGVSQNRVAVVPGPDTKDGGEGPGIVVFPNPYRGESAWDGQYPRERLIYFANLPRRCMIRIFTIAGDLVDTIEFDSETYHATDNAVLYDPNFQPPILSGGLAAWDLLTREDQSVASGLYVFSVENTDTGKIDVGKFLVIR